MYDKIHYKLKKKIKLKKKKKPQFCSRSSGEGIPLHITYYVHLNLFIFCYSASQCKACFPISLPLKPIAQCLQFMLPCFGFSSGYPLLQPNFPRVYHFITILSHLFKFHFTPFNQTFLFFFFFNASDFHVTKCNG